MTEKRLDNSYFKAFLWNKKWGRPFESLFGLMLNFCRVNAISGRTAAKLLLQALRTIHEENRTGKEPRPDDECMMYDLLQSEQNTAGMKTFLNMSRETRTQVFCRCLQYCPECMKVGYHSVFHQLVNARTCPIHKTALISEGSIFYKGCEDRILYEMDLRCIINSRNIIHPSLRSSDDISFEAPENLSEYKSISHYVSASDELYYKVCESIHRAQDFFLYKKYDRHIKVRHSFTTVDEAVEELKRGDSLPGAIREYQNQVAYDTDQRTLPLSDVNVREYFIYCMCMNFTRAERAKTPLKLDMYHQDVLYKKDLTSLKFSFLWSIKDADNPFNVLSLHWIIHPASSDNYSRRGVFNGIRLETVRIDARETGLSDTDALIADIYIIEDLFKQLWHQYVNLAKRPCGVSVWRGWKELVIPEYFICHNNTGQGFDIYRLDPVIP